MDAKIPKSIELKGDKIILCVHAKPGSKKEGISYIDDDCIEIAIHAQAQNNKANFALIEYLADILDLSKSSVKLETGGTSRNKLISINTNLKPEEILAKLNDNLL